MLCPALPLLKPLPALAWPGLAWLDLPWPALPQFTCGQVCVFGGVLPSSRSHCQPLSHLKNLASPLKLAHIGTVKHTFALQNSRLHLNTCFWGCVPACLLVMPCFVLCQPARHPPQCYVCRGSVLVLDEAHNLVRTASSSGVGAATALACLATCTVFSVVPPFP